VIWSTAQHEDTGRALDQLVFHARAAAARGIELNSGRDYDRSICVYGHLVDITLRLRAKSFLQEAFPVFFYPSLEPVDSLTQADELATIKSWRARKSSSSMY